MAKKSTSLTETPDSISSENEQTNFQELYLKVLSDFQHTQKELEYWKDKTHTLAQKLSLAYQGHLMLQGVSEQNAKIQAQNLLNNIL